MNSPSSSSGRKDHPQDQEAPQLHAHIQRLISQAPRDVRIKKYFFDTVWPELESGYAAMTKEVKRYCAQHVNVAANIESRVKSRTSIEKSIDRREEHRKAHGKVPYMSLEGIFEDVHDLAGIRITVDFLSDTETVNRFIVDAFQQRKAPNIFSRARNVGKSWKTLFGAYESWNHHVVLGPRATDISHEFDNVMFEIQVTCLAESLYNKLAHPLLYKEKSGTISRKDEMVIDLSHGVALCFSICHLLMQDKLDGQEKSISRPDLREAIIKTAAEPETGPLNNDMDVLASLTTKIIPGGAQMDKMSRSKRRRSFGKTIPIDSLLGAISGTSDEQECRGDIWANFTKRLEDWDLGVQKMVAAIERQTETLSQYNLNEQDRQCLEDLCILDPEHQKLTIENTKGGLLKDVYRWILDDEHYRKFRSDTTLRLLWIRGDPGKGKTMLICGIIDELKNETNKPITYFFYQATEKEERRSAVGALRSLIMLLCKQRSELVSYVREKYDIQRKNLFEGSYAMAALESILRDMLNNPYLGNAIFVIDALDECLDDDRGSLIRLITKLSKCFPAKWIVSSRNWPDIEEQIGRDCANVQVCLELNKDSISTAVKLFIEDRVRALTEAKKYDPALKQKVIDTLQHKADDTFLWVSLVCEQLGRSKNRRRHTEQILESIPVGLNGLYGRMLERTFENTDRDILRQVLATACVAFEHLSIEELRNLVIEIKESDFEREDVEDLIKECGSFLTLEEGTVYFVHQTATDFLRSSDQIFPKGISHHHRLLFEQSLASLKVLTKNIYQLKSPGQLNRDQTDEKEWDDELDEEFTPPSPDPLAGLRYACLYWVHHLEETQERCSSRDDERIRHFITTRLLNWLEALSLLGRIPEGVKAVGKLESTVRNKATPALTAMVEDMRRFVYSFQQIIKMAPLQTYISALVFSPTNSLIRKAFERDEILDVERISGMPLDWDQACTQIIDFQAYWVAFSHDGCIAAVDYDGRVKIWGVASGQCIDTLHAGRYITDIAFSHDGGWLAIGNKSAYASEIWDLRSTPSLRDHLVELLPSDKDAELGEDVKVVFLAGWGNLLVYSASHLQVWDPSTRRSVQTTKLAREFAPPGIYREKFAASMDGQQLACTTFGNYGSPGQILVWDFATAGDQVRVLEGHTGEVMAIAFSTSDACLLASASRDGTIRIWDTAAGTCKYTFDHYRNLYCSNLCFGDYFVAVTNDDSHAIRIYDFTTGACTQILSGHSNMVLSLAYHPSTHLLASASVDGSIRVWDMKAHPTHAHAHAQSTQPSQRRVIQLKFSNNIQLLASLIRDASGSPIIDIWDTSSQRCIHTLDTIPGFDMPEILFSPDDRWLACVDGAEGVHVSDTSNWECALEYCTEDDDLVLAAALSSNHHHAAMIQRADETISIEVWILNTGNIFRTCQADFYWFVPDPEAGEWEFGLLEFSQNGQWIAACSCFKICIYNVELPSTLLSIPINTPTTLRALPAEDFRFLTGQGTVYRGDDLSLQIDPSKRYNPKYSDSAHSLIYYRSWIRKGAERILWVPPEYRSSIEVASSTVAMAGPAGQILVFKLPLTYTLPNLQPGSLILRTYKGNNKKHQH